MLIGSLTHDPVAPICAKAAVHSKVFDSLRDHSCCGATFTGPGSCLFRAACQPRSCINDVTSSASTAPLFTAFSTCLHNDRLSLAHFFSRLSVGMMLLLCRTGSPFLPVLPFCADHTQSRGRTRSRRNFGAVLSTSPRFCFYSGGNRCTRIPHGCTRTFVLFI